MPIGLMQTEKPLLITNATIFTPVSSASWQATWQTQQFAPGAMLLSRERVLAVGPENEIESVPLAKRAERVDAGGRLLTPGFVDCHTHPVFHQLRAHEFELRIKGASYEEISRSGGGIRFSVRDLRQVSSEQLLACVLARLDSFLAFGTTTIEAKSGYGLSVPDEIKSLQVLRQAAAMHPVDIVPTFLGAHEIPDEYRSRRQAYIELVINEMLPRVVEANLASFIDVFCEDSVFTAEESKRILQAGEALGLRAKIHADQLHDSGGARVAADVGATSADHLEYTPPELDGRLADAEVVPVMLPGADFFLASRTYGPARRMIANGLPVALATDFNPGTCMSESMQMMLTLACLYLRMTPAEALTAATYHAAKAIARDAEIGTLEPGKLADFVIWEVSSLPEIPYHFAVNHVADVYKRGKLVYSKPRT